MLKDILSYGIGTLVGFTIIAGLLFLFIRDVTQKKHAVLRNYPVVGRLRYFFESMGEYLRQYFFAGDRDVSAVPLFGFNGNNVNVGASSTTPFGRFGFSANGGRLPNGAPGTLTLIPGRPGTAPGDFQPFNLSTDGYNFAPDNYLLTPQERTGVYVQGRYQITDSITFNTAIVYNERRSEQQLAAVPFVFGTAGSGLNRFTIPASALYNPFGVDVTGLNLQIFAGCNHELTGDCANKFQNAINFGGFAFVPNKNIFATGL